MFSANESRGAGDRDQLNWAAKRESAIWTKSFKTPALLFFTGYFFVFTSWGNQPLWKWDNLSASWEYVHEDLFGTKKCNFLAHGNVRASRNESKVIFQLMGNSAKPTNDNRDNNAIISPHLLKLPLKPNIFCYFSCFHLMDIRVTWAGNINHKRLLETFVFYNEIRSICTNLQVCEYNLII